MATFPKRRSFFKVPPRRNDFPPAGAQAVLETGRDGSGGKTDVNRTGYPRPGIPSPRLITCPPRLTFRATPIAWGADAPAREDRADRTVRVPSTPRSTALAVLPFTETSVETGRAALIALHGATGGANRKDGSNRLSDSPPALQRRSAMKSPS